MEIAPLERGLNAAYGAPVIHPGSDLIVYI